MKKMAECPDMMDLLVEYLEGDLDEEKERHLEFHLELCPPCMNFLDSYKKTGKVCRSALEKNMPPELKSNLKMFLKEKCDCHDE